MLNPAQRYLTLRALGAPAILLSLAMQGVFRGFKDTKTPLYATGTSSSSTYRHHSALFFSDDFFTCTVLSFHGMSLSLIILEDHA